MVVHELVRIPTSLGPVVVEVSASGRHQAECSIGVRVVDHEPRWMKSGPVESLRVAIVHIRCEHGIETARMDCHLEGQPIDDYQNGEWLEARSYVKGTRLVILGTEDGDVVSHRIPGLIAPDDEPFALVGSHDEAIRTNLSTRELLTELSLHVAVAENPHPEPKALAAWDAVNVNHAALIGRHGLPLGPP